MPDHPPLDGLTSGVVGAIPPPVDIRPGEARLPAHIRAIPKG